MNDKEIHIVDAYNPDIYPGDDFAATAIKTPIHIFSSDDDESYLNKLKSHIPKAYEAFKPELIIYNAGTDCLEGDPLGRLSISSEGIVRRDELIFLYALETYQIPIVMVLSGGYQFSNAPIIADSIENIVSKFKLKVENELKPLVN